VNQKQKIPSENPFGLPHVLIMIVIVLAARGALQDIKRERPKSRFAVF